MMAATNGRQDPNTHFPRGADAGSSITRSGFTITTRKLPILKAEPIDDMTAKLGIMVPEMIFGDNSVHIEHASSGWAIDFNAFDALNRVDKTGESMLQVAHSKEWQSSRYALDRKFMHRLMAYRQDQHSNINRIVKPFDWSYSTDYKGTVSPESPPFTESEAPIPLDLLKRPDPILFFDEVVLYEDEMADNGITMLSCKIRVMPDRLLLLSRFFMRLDNVLFRLRDTRVFVEFVTGDVIREYVAKEESYDVIREVRKQRWYRSRLIVRQKLSETQRDVHAQMRDPNSIADLLPVVDRSLEQIKVK